MGRKKAQFALADQVTRADGSAVDQKVLAEIANVEAEFLDIQNYRRKQTNNLLGVFDGEEYIILDEMKARLLEIPKKFDRFEGNSMYVSAVLGSFVLTFRVDMELEPDFCRGKLFFIEIESGVAGDSKHVTLLDDVLDIYDPEFRAKLDKKWHIYYGGQAPSYDSFLERYMKMQLDEVYFCRELVDVLSQLYVTRMLAFVVELGEKGVKIEKEYKELAKEYAEKDPDFANKHEVQKEILDMVIKQNGAMQEIVKTEEGRKILQAYSQPLKNVRDKAYPSILTEDISRKKKVEGEATDENSEEKNLGGQGKAKGAAPKSSGGKKSSGGGKKSKPYVPPKLKLRPIITGKVDGQIFDFGGQPPIEQGEKDDLEMPKIVADPIYAATVGVAVAATLDGEPPVVEPKAEEPKNLDADKGETPSADKGAPSAGDEDLASVIGEEFINVFGGSNSLYGGSEIFSEVQRETDNYTPDSGIGDVLGREADASTTPTDPTKPMEKSH